MTAHSSYEKFRDLISGLNEAKVDALAESPYVYRHILSRKYSEPHRGYHTLDHIGNCLRTLESTSPGSLPAAKLALWFHDVVYDPRRKDNEERSAHVLRGACALMGTPESIVESAAEAVLATKHVNDPYAVRSEVVKQTLDADLSSLGAPWDQFVADTAGIRKEYSFVPDDAWRAGRVKVLRGFLDRSRLYFTDEFHARFDVRARTNLRRAVAELECAGTVPGAFVACGEGGNFCSSGCQAAAADR